MRLKHCTCVRYWLATTKQWKSIRAPTWPVSGIYFSRLGNDVTHLLHRPLMSLDQYNFSFQFVISVELSVCLFALLNCIDLIVKYLYVYFFAFSISVSFFVYSNVWSGYIYIYIYMGWVRVVMVSSVENRHAESSSNPGRGYFHFT